MAKWTVAKDKAWDKKNGVKEGSKKDITLDKKRGVYAKEMAEKKSKKGGKK